MCGVCAPAGGLPALPPAYTAFSFVFLPLSPQPPSRREGGDYRLFYARGFAPCIPGAEPGRHWFALPLWKTQWGLAPALPARRASAVPGGGACRLCRLPALPLRCPRGSVPALSPANPTFNLFPCPLSPRPPSPPGKGEIFCFLMQGASPLASPGLNPRGTGYACGKLVLWALLWHRHPPGQREPVL